MAKHRMRNTANKMTNPIDPIHRKSFFCHLLKYLSEMDLRLSLRLSLIIKAHARLATSQLRNSSLSQSGTDMWFSAFKTSRPATRSFCHYPTWSRSEVKNHYPSVWYRYSNVQPLPSPSQQKIASDKPPSDPQALVIFTLLIPLGFPLWSSLILPGK